MRLLILVLVTTCVLVDSQESGQTSAGPGGEAAQMQAKNNCCLRKTVGSKSYTLKETTDFFPIRCKNGCVYQEDNTNEEFCFAPGGLPATCDPEEVKCKDPEGKIEDLACKNDLLIHCDSDGTWKNNGTKCSELLQEDAGRTFIHNNSPLMCWGFFARSNSPIIWPGNSNVGAIKPLHIRTIDFNNVDVTTAVFSCATRNLVSDGLYSNLCGYDPKIDFTLTGKYYVINSPAEYNCILSQQQVG